jgi:hypothetical protein
VLRGSWREKSVTVKIRLFIPSGGGHACFCSSIVLNFFVYRCQVSGEAQVPREMAINNAAPTAATETRRPVKLQRLAGRCGVPLKATVRLIGVSLCWKGRRGNYAW